MTNRTTINIKKEIRKTLKQMRKHRRDTYDDVLEELIKTKLERRKK